MNKNDTSTHPEDDVPPVSIASTTGQSGDGILPFDPFDDWFDKCLAELDREFGTSGNSEPEPPYTPEETARDEAIAACLNGRICIYREKSLVCPVHVECARAESRLIRAVCVTRPWKAGTKTRRFSVGMNFSSASAFNIELIGYDMNATFVHAPEAVAAIDEWALPGRSVDDLIKAARRAHGLPPEVQRLIDLPFEPTMARLPSPAPAGIENEKNAGNRSQ